jgi:hypothetical protein
LLSKSDANRESLASKKIVDLIACNRARESTSLLEKRRHAGLSYAFRLRTSTRIRLSFS